MRWGRLGLALAGMVLVFGALALALVPAAAVQEQDRPPDAPDFTAVTTRAPPTASCGRVGW